MTHKPEPVSVARQFLDSQYPGAPIAFLGGSVATGTATPTSDLDILVVLDDQDPQISYARTVNHNGWLIEEFVHSMPAARAWIERGRTDRAPVMDTIAASGIPLTCNAATARWQEDARAALAGGSAALTPAERDQRRYDLSAAIDDLAGSADPAETAAVSWVVFQQASELTLLLHGRWLGTGKWLIRHFRADPDPLGRELADWAGGSSHAPQRLTTLAMEALELAGGYLQAGHTRGSDPGRPPMSE